MNLTTKFNLNQEVFIIKDNIMYRAKIKCISISVLESGQVNVLYFFHSKVPVSCSEQFVFETETEARKVYSELPIVELK